MVLDILESQLRCIYQKKFIFVSFLNLFKDETTKCRPTRLFQVVYIIIIKNRNI